MAGRVKAFRILLILFLAAVGIRAFYLQVIQPDTVISLAHRKFDYNVKLSSYRGTIYDKSGQPLAISLDVKSIAANPRLIDRPASCAAKLARVLKINEHTLKKKLESDKYFTWIKRHASPDEVAKVEALGIRGIGYYNEPKRFYPEGESMANVLGFVGVDGQGLEGLELLYDGVLQGKPRHIDVRKDGLGRIIYARGLTPDETKDGYTVWLTIDRRLQYIAFSEIERAVKKNRATSGFVIITNPVTGEICAMASYPGFNPNIGSYKNLQGHKNRAVVDRFEPGSVIKPMWISWGMEYDILNPVQNVFCENGRFTYHRTVINDHKKYGWLPVRDVIKFSSNIGMVKLLDPVRAADMYACLDLFGLLAPTGIEFPGEPGGFVREPKRWTSVDKAAVSFGQGFAVTGIQLITSFNAMINGGMLMKPYLVDHITDAKGNELEHFRPTIVRKVVSADTSRKTLEILKSVVSKGGTAETAGMETYQVFGKTGTAQKVDPLTGVYSKSDYISTFMGGLLDASGRPRLSVIVTINEPRPHYYASIVACPVFKSIVQKCASVMDISPNITVASKGGTGGEGI
jgi:cell division protein FtsI (penicillin-binding protein 3)